LYLFAIAGIVFLAKTIDLPYGYIPEWFGYIGLGLMFWVSCSWPLTLAME
jgi:hypothetical protein